MTRKLTVTAKGQVTLRKEILDHLGVAPGAMIEVDLVAPGRVEVRAARSGHGIEEFVGCLKDPDDPTLSLDEIGNIARQGWAGEADPDR